MKWENKVGSVAGFVATIIMSNYGFNSTISTGASSLLEKLINETVSNNENKSINILIDSVVEGFIELDYELQNDECIKEIAAVIFSLENLSSNNNKVILKESLVDILDKYDSPYIEHGLDIDKAIVLFLDKAHKKILNNHELCSKDINLTVHRIEEKLERVSAKFNSSINQEQYLDNNQTSYGYYLLDTILKDINEPTFEDTHVERKVWDYLANHFCLGHPMDKIIGDILSSNATDMYPYDINLFLKYFLARFKFKQGKSDEGNLILYEISQNYNKIGTKAAQRLQVLVESRYLIENVNKDSNYIKKLHNITDKIGNISDSKAGYTEYEIASAYGKGITNLFSNELTLNKISLAEIKSIANKHLSLYLKYPNILANQEIVGISLFWFINLEELKNSISVIDDIEFFSNLGFEKSISRKNSLFYIQSTIVLIILQRLKKKIADENIYVLAILVGKLMKKLKIEVTHEGISQLLIFMKAIDSNIYKFMLSAISSPDTMSYNDIGIDNNKISRIRARVDWLWNIYEASKGAIYNVNIEELLN